MTDNKSKSKTKELFEELEEESKRGELSEEDLIAARDAINKGEPGLPAEMRDNTENPQEKKVDENNIRKLLQDAKFPDKLKMALYGKKECRAILINDKNKMIQTSVLKNPKLTVGEVEEWARNTNMTDGILRKISDNNEWMKTYNIKRNLTMNPKSPVGVSLRWLKFLYKDDIRKISRSKNMPTALVSAARKRLNDETG